MGWTPTNTSNPLNKGVSYVPKNTTNKNTGSGIRPTQYMNNGQKPTPVVNTTKSTTNTNKTPQGSVSQAVVAGRADAVSKNNANTKNNYYTVYSGNNRIAIDSVTGKNVGTQSGTYNPKIPVNPVNPVNDVVPSVDTSSVYNDLLQAMMERNEQARQDAIDAILSNLDAVKGTYKSQLQTVIDEYNKLVDENEVAKDRARRMVKENQANRGQLDSGLGRQERLNLDIGYDNKTADINLARQQAVNEIYNLIAQAEAEAKANKASVNNQYNNSLLEWQIANS